MDIPPKECRDVIDWEGAGDWTTSSFLAQLADLDKPFADLDEDDVLNCLDAAQAIAAQSVRFLSSKGLIHSLQKGG